MSEEKTISFEKHQEIGMICKILNVRLVTRIVEVMRAQKTKKEGAKKSYHYKKANEALSSFKNHMEEIMCIEFPEKWNTGVYYGERPCNFESKKRGKIK